MIKTLISEQGAQAKITDHGAQVISWIPAQRTEQLFLSKTSSFEPGSAIRGGVPVIFPQFADRGPLPKHGFARNAVWQLRDSEQTDRCVFALRDDASSRAIWPHQFLAELTVTLSDASLGIELAIQNCGATSMQFTAALHTYFRVDQIDEVVLIGLKGAKFKGGAPDDAPRIETAQALRIDGPIDRIYENATNQLEIVQKHQRVVVHKQGFPDAVVWNPWQELGARLPDLEPDGYRRMLCVESAAVAKPVYLSAGATWHASQRLNFFDDLENKKTL